MDYPGHISGFRSRPINAIVDAGRASRPVAGAGIRVDETPSGSVVSADPRSTAPRPYPFMTAVVRDYDPSVSSQAVFAVQVYLGRVFRDGAEIPFDPGELDVRTDAASGMDYALLPLDGETAEVLAVVSDGEEGPSWTLSAEAPEGAVAYAVASVSAGAVSQRLAGDLYLDSHWGAVEPLVELAADGDGEWRAVREAGGSEEPSAVAESSLVDIEVDADGKVTARHYRTRTVDSRGNVVAISERTEDAAPDPGEAEDGGAASVPECGHPLNDPPDDHHPLGGGGEDSAGADDYHPLDHEGDGGFTPKCADPA